MTTANHEEVLRDMMIEYDCIRLGSYAVFDDRAAPYIIDFDPLLGRADTLSKLASIFHSAMDERELRDPSRVSFLLGNALTGIPLATAVALDIYRKHDNPENDFRLGYFVKDEDITVSVDSKRTEGKIRRLYPHATILGTIPVRDFDLRGRDLLGASRAEVARLLNLGRDLYGDVDSLVAAGYAAMPFVVGMATVMQQEMGRNAYMAFERPSPKSYDRSSGSDLMGSVNPNGKVIIILPQENPSFGGRLQDGDSVLIFDDVAARESTAIGAVRKVGRANPRAKVTGMMVGVDRKEKEGEKRLDETLQLEGMELFYVTNGRELVERWHQYPDPAKRLGDQEYEQLIEYQAKYCY